MSLDVGKWIIYLLILLGKPHIFVRHVFYLYFIKSSKRSKNVQNLQILYFRSFLPTFLTCFWKNSSYLPEISTNTPRCTSFKRGNPKNPSSKPFKINKCSKTNRYIYPSPYIPHIIIIITSLKVNFSIHLSQVSPAASRNQERKNLQTTPAANNNSINCKQVKHLVMVYNI